MPMDKPDKPTETESGELPPINNAPARVPTPVLLRQLQSVLERMKRAEAPVDEAAATKAKTEK
jgi:hypothetical protein